MRVTTVVGTRPEIIRLSRIIPALDTAFEHTLIHTGQNDAPELNQVFFDEMCIRKPNLHLNTTEHRTFRRNTPMETIAAVLVKLDDMFALNKRPDAVLILGDTNSCLATAYAAKRHKIPLFHMEAGNRSFDDRVPEEINRRMIDHISDINMPYSALARENLINEGLAADRIIRTGSPMLEVLNHYRTDISRASIFNRIGLVAGKYFIVSCHREENIEAHFADFLNVLKVLADTYEQRVIVSTHPRMTKRLGAYRPPALIEFHPPFGFLDYVHLQSKARAVLSDSGTITEESAILGFPALNLRESHERPEGMEEGSVMLTGFNPDRIINAIAVLSSRQRMTVPKDYLVGNVADKVVSIILSHVDVVNRNVWRKQ